MTKLEELAIGFYRADLEHKRAKQSVRDSMQEWEVMCNFEHRDVGEWIPRCYDAYPHMPFDEWCDSCKARQPLWEARQKAAHGRGAALTKLLRACGRVGGTR